MVHEAAIDTVMNRANCAASADDAITNLHTTPNNLSRNKETTIMGRTSRVSSGGSSGYNVRQREIPNRRTTNDFPQFPTISENNQGARTLNSSMDDLQPDLEANAPRKKLQLGNPMYVTRRNGTKYQPRSRKATINAAIQLQNEDDRELFSVRNGQVRILLKSQLN